MRVKIPVIRFKEPRAFKKSKKMNPSDIEVEMRIFFKIKFSVKIVAKNKGIKKYNNWV